LQYKKVMVEVVFVRKLLHASVHLYMYAIETKWPKNFDFFSFLDLFPKVLVQIIACSTRFVNVLEKKNTFDSHQCKVSTGNVVKDVHVCGQIFFKQPHLPRKCAYLKFLNS
jgi:hypothetical protein